TWILHLARSVGFPADPGNRSLLLVKNGLWEFQPLPNARKVLQELLNLYWQGMRAPLAFFPAAALAYARQVFVAGKSREAALQSAEKTWQGGEFKRGESEDPYFHLCFAPPAPLGETFCQLAEAVFAPLFQAAIETPV
ncbi:MAG: hypothetical protein MUP74_01210, partial [Desulfobacterales bacterium]|nr:hypothetical protein [Desulfobacterales bacterium]